jgi:dihydroorotase
VFQCDINVLTVTDYCLRGARIIDPSQNLDEIRDLWVMGGRITFSRQDGEVESIDVSEKVIMPGMVDLRSHLHAPESLASVSRAAAAGGYTTILTMPDVCPPADNPGAIRLMQEKASKAATINFLQCGCLTRGSKGDELAPLGSLKEAGVVAVSDCPDSPQNTEIFVKGLEYASMFDLPVIEFPRDLSISTLGVAHDGPTALKMGIGGYPRMAEELFVQRAIVVSRNIRVNIHLTSISSSGSVELIRDAKAKGIRITADATPHHLTLTDEKILGYDSNSKTMPPLREKSDRKAILAGVLDGTIDCICTAHEPCHEHEKQVEFDLAPAGIIGYETALPVVYGELSKHDNDPFRLIVQTMSENPSRILKLPDRSIAEGALADFVVFDPNKEWRYNSQQGVSVARNSPFNDCLIKGSVVTTFSLGKRVYAAVEG